MTLTSIDPEQVEPLPTIEPPATAAAGTNYDGDPLFEALVFGWACAHTTWNGERSAGSAESNRRALVGYFEQYLEQQGDSSGDELREKAAAQVFGRGQLIWIGENGVPVVLTVAETYSRATADMLELIDAGRERVLLASLLRWSLRRIGEDA